MSEGNVFWTAIAVGAAPTMSMILCSLFISSIEVAPWISASLQNFAAGLILAAVGNELFPLLSADVTPTTSMIGTTIGFVAALGILHGLDALTEYFEEEEEDGDGHHSSNAGGEDEKGFWKKNKEFYKKIANAKGIKLANAGKSVSDKSSSAAGAEEGDLAASGIEMSLDGTRSDIIPAESDNESEMDDEEASIRESFAPAKSMGDWEDGSMQVSTRAIHNLEHRRHIEEHLQEILDSVKGIQGMAQTLVETSETGAAPSDEGGNSNPVQAMASQGAGRNLSLKDSDQISERMDEEIHSLQYKLDHSRRLLQGTEFDFDLSEDGELPDWAANAVINPENKGELTNRIDVLRVIAEHLLEHIQGTAPIGPSELKEVYHHMDEMHENLESFHTTVEKIGRRWKSKRELMMPSLGATVPTSLLVPVTMDCFTDGLLIGVAVAINTKAGLVLGLANTLEMGTLGMAYSCRISKCTGSTLLVRNLTLYIPPICMFLSAGLGAFIADAASDDPVIYVAFVGFGVVALLSLVCGELLIEAREAQGDDDKWYINLWVIIGVYLVLMISPNLEV
jgi:zinc transporter ZupT